MIIFWNTAEIYMDGKNSRTLSLRADWKTYHEVMKSVQNKIIN
jgi:hypothetical protein